MLNTIHTTALAVFAVLALSLGLQAEMYKNYEMPPHRIEMVDGAVTVRAYDAHLVAEVTVEGTRSSAIREGFRVLANYIFGGNQRAEAVSMTVPVSQLPAAEGQQAAQMSDGSWRVRFMMPGAYGMDDLPRPNNDAVALIEVAPERQLVLQFSGMTGTGVLNRKADELARYADARGLSIKGAPRYYFYDDPFTLPWKRRNEVAFALN